MPSLAHNIQSRFHLSATVVIFFVSGCAGLVYQVLWMKELGLLFGNTAHAAATTLAAFFLGLAAGGYVWGRLAGRLRYPLKVYAGLELGIAVTALLYFLLLHAYHAVYTHLFDLFGPGNIVFGITKFTLAIGILFFPAFFMGGTLPVISQHLVRRADALGMTASLLYAVNTLGAGLGAFLAGFYLPRWLGFTNSYLLAVAITFTVAVLAWLLGRQQKVSPIASGEAVDGEGEGSALPPVTLSVQGIRALAFISGFVTLSLEVLWTRMFAQVLQNSVYTFSTILVTFIVALAAGAALAASLARRCTNSTGCLVVLLLASAVTVILSMPLFIWATDGLRYVGAAADWTGYLLRVFGIAALVVLLPGILMGSVFPYLFKISEGFRRGAGRTVGDLIAVNTIAAVLGSLCAGFILLELIGLWKSILMMGAVYLLAGILLADRLLSRRLALTAIAPGVLLLVVMFSQATRLPLVTAASDEGNEELVEVWEGSAATVAVVRRPNTLRIKLNNYYTLGGTDALTNEQRQAHLPLLMHPAPASVFFLGMGTGITAGAAVSHPLDRVVVTELVPEVVRAARKHFRPYLNGLFDDSRVTVVAEDGRNFLFGSRQRFDVIVSDLFVPYKAGTGSLYTREHYRAARARLTSNGIYAQWLPLYQMSRLEFGIVARTMLEVFPRVTVWRGDFHASKPILLLAGHNDEAVLEIAGLTARLRQLRQAAVEQDDVEHIGYDPVPWSANTMLLYYAGNLTEAAELVDGFPANTDDWSMIEYQAPITHRGEKANQAAWFVGMELIDFLEELLATAPPAAPAEDPYLQQASGNQLALPRAGLLAHRAQALAQAGDTAGAERIFGDFQSIWEREALWTD
jgi:spermidine synthase